VAAQRKPNRKPQQAPRPAQQRSGRPASQQRSGQRQSAVPASPRPFLTPGASPFRQSVERRSAVAVVALRALPKAMPGLLVLALLAGALIVQGVGGAVLVLVVALLLTWLVYLSWPALPGAGRAVRLATIAALVAFAVNRVA
jgi:hypothetical protein